MEEVTGEMSELILFEVPTYAVGRLSARIARRWPGSTTRDEDVWYVTARFQEDAADLAALLREVEACVFDLNLQAIRYCLDGRFYILEAPSYEVAVRPYVTNVDAS